MQAWATLLHTNSSRQLGLECNAITSPLDQASPFRLLAYAEVPCAVKVLTAETSLLV
jgi:hypothetical protein